MAQALLERFDGEVPTELDGSRDAARCRPQDRQRRAQRRVRAAGPARRHARRQALEAPRAQRAEDPVKLELELNSFLPPPERGPFSLRMILHGRRICDAKRPNCFEMRLGGHLSVVARSRAERHERTLDDHSPWHLARCNNRCIVAVPTRFPPPGLRAMPGSAAWHCRATAPFIGAVAASEPVFSGLSVDQLQRPPQQTLGVAQPLFRFADGRPQILPPRRNSQRTDLGELLPISLYVFGDDRQSGRDWVVHGCSLARPRIKSSLPGWRRCRYRGRTVQSVTVRDDLRALEGYHSPQVDVRVRLNTNESPTPPPAAWRDAFAAELSRVEWHRYPDRSATALRSAIADWHGVRRGPGVRRQRVERGAADLPAGLRRRRPPGRHVRADVPDARSHRPPDRCHRGRRRARARLPARPSVPQSA